MDTRSYHAFDTFVSVVREHANPSSTIAFHVTRHGPDDVVSIMDYSLPKRTGVCHTGYADSDWYRDSYVCNVTRTAGFIPRENFVGDFRYQEVSTGREAGFEIRPAKGYLTCLQQLLYQGVIVPSHKLDSILREESRKYANPRYRYLYR